MLPLKEEDILEAYKRVVNRFSGDLSDLVTKLKESVAEELKQENIKDLEPIQTLLTETRKQIMEILKSRKSGVISQKVYNNKYEELLNKVKRLEEEEAIIQSSNSLSLIKIEQLKTINKALDNSENNLYDSQIMRTLLNCIKVIDKHTLEFQFNCNLNIIEKLGSLKSFMV